MSRPPPINAETAHAIYDILVLYAGAACDPDDRAAFVYAQMEGCTEYRFVGHLGFGGKFWNNNGRWYINCYPEDTTPRRQDIERDVNAKLTRLIPANPTGKE